MSKLKPQDSVTLDSLERLRKNDKSMVNANEVFAAVCEHEEGDLMASFVVRSIARLKRSIGFSVPNSDIALFGKVIFSLRRLEEVGLVGTILDDDNKVRVGTYYYLIDQAANEP